MATTPSSSAARQKPQQTALAPSVEAGLVKPLAWESRIFLGAMIAVSIRDVQTICMSKHGPPNDNEARQFLLYCAGYGVDPRIGQAYMIPFEQEDERSGKKWISWQKGLSYLTFTRLASRSAPILGHVITPDPAGWPRLYPGDDFMATITIRRRSPLHPVRYSAYVGSVAQKRDGKLARAWADGKVGWAHMFRKALILRGYREAFGLPAYAPEDFGEASADFEDQVVDAIFAPASEDMPAPAQGEPENAAETQEAAGEGVGEESAPATAEEPNASAAGSQGAETAAPEAEAAEGEDSGPPACPKCAGEMTLKHGRQGPFFSCNGYPKCRGSVDASRQKRTKPAIPTEATPVAPAEEVLGPDEGQKSAMLGLVEAFGSEFGMSVAPPNGYDKAPRRGIAEWIAAKENQLAALRQANAETSA